MPFARRWVLGLALTAASLTGCSTSSGRDSTTETAVRLEDVSGTTSKRVILSARAVERLGLETAAVAEVRGPTGLVARTIPYAALLYDPSGATWVYTVVAERAYQRVRVAVDRIDGDVVKLTDGPPPGTAVVTLGATELYGAESTFGQD